MNKELKDLKTKKNRARGKKAKANGANFERRVRKDLEDKSWIVAKWQNNVSDFPEGNINKPTEEREDRKLIPAKNKFNPFSKAMMLGGGFPDFIAFRIADTISCHNYCEVIGVESKVLGYLDKVERAKCEWLLKNKIFSRILIAQKTKVKNKIIIKYKDFK